ncbi:MAG: pyridoxamine 5'-phosphate oxidase family protein [Propionibacteriaceae bacterium]|nr:pyridoxamine 5'-phosphate oxidase family protein [Propionibacteriaceae bacterium]
MEMRRADRAIKDHAEIVAVLNAAEVAHIGLVDDEGVYVVPVSYACAADDNGQVTCYLHGARQGRKIEAIRHRPEQSVCVEVELRHATFGQDGPKVCDVGVWYDCVIAYGRARVVDDPIEARRGLGLLVEKFAPGRSVELADQVPGYLAIIAIDLTQFSGKRRTIPQQ